MSSKIREALELALEINSRSGGWSHHSQLYTDALKELEATELRGESPMIKEQRVAHEGMSLRDYFAGQALAGLLGNSALDRISFGRSHQKENKNMAMCVYAIADAMIVEREAEGGES